MGCVRLYVGNELRKQVVLDKERVTIGRIEDNQLVLADAGVSRLHAAIEYHDGDYYVVDLGSRNGVFLNGEKVERAKLKFWDEIQIHNFVIKYMAKPGLQAEVQDEQTASADLNQDKTKFFNLSDETQLERLRSKTKQCYVSYKDETGKPHTLRIKKPRIILGKSKAADIKISGWFAPSVAARIERLGSKYELIPGKRGKVILQNQPIDQPTRLTDGCEFVVRDVEFKFFNRLAETQ